MEFFARKDTLDKAIDKLDKGHTYQALDIINKHIREVLEIANPTVDKIKDSLTEYKQMLDDSKEILEKSTRETASIEVSMLEEARNKLNAAIKRLGTIEESCKIMTRCREKLD